MTNNCIVAHSNVNILFICRCSITVKAETVEDDDEEDDDDVSPSDLIVSGRAISVRFGHNRDRASASSLSVPLTSVR